MNVVGRHLIHCFGKQNVVRCIGSDIHKIIEKVMILYSMILFLRHDRTINPTATRFESADDHRSDTSWVGLTSKRYKSKSPSRSDTVTSCRPFGCQAG